MFRESVCQQCKMNFAAPSQHLLTVNEVKSLQLQLNIEAMKHYHTSDVPVVHNYFNSHHTPVSAPMLLPLLPVLLSLFGEDGSLQKCDSFSSEELPSPVSTKELPARSQSGDQETDEKRLSSAVPQMTSSDCGESPLLKIVACVWSS
ncbi:hypothetical protein F2P81_010708 [Scophthalmus maximus]|uniref:Uncharacterized protein n=1 Tax=Scophthalmus maximus TaxID=52904 RepID=A0A6A4T3N4_SCOMX|nr:hypothetical protein F2P81_010708 [Scophthalmus maximus]